jgi:hypothetical protein
MLNLLLFFQYGRKRYSVYYKASADELLIKESSTSPHLAISISDFSEITSIVYHPRNHTVYLTGTVKTALKTRTGDKARLYRWSISEGKWVEIFKEYCYNPVPMPLSNDIAIDTGFGVAVLDQDGKVKTDCHYQRVRCSSRILCPSPDGTRIVFCRYRGDDRRFVLFDVANNTAIEYKPSWYSYSWFDNQTLIFEHSSALKLFSLSTQKSTNFIGELFKSETNRQSISKTGIIEFFEPGGIVKHIDYHDIQMQNGRVYFLVFISGITVQNRDKKYTSTLDIHHIDGYIEKHLVETIGLSTYFKALFSIGKNAKNLRLEYLCSPEYSIERYTVDIDGTIVLSTVQKSQFKVIEQKRIVIGNGNSPLHDQWLILPDGSVPENRYGSFQHSVSIGV